VQQSIRESTGTLLEMTPSAGAASTDTGTLISASAARRIACQAGILPAVLGGPGQILDLGRHHRFFSDPQRTALSVVYDNAPKCLSCNEILDLRRSKNHVAGRHLVSEEYSVVEQGCACPGTAPAWWLTRGAWRCGCWPIGSA
jgi:hypothetical protein